MQRPALNNLKLLIWFTVILAVIILSVLRITQTSREAKAAPADTEGVTLIRSMESAPVAPIEDHIFEMEKDEIRQQILQDPGRTFQTLADIHTVILGDSRVVGFSIYGFMDPSTVLAGTSWSILEIPALYQTLEQMNPRFVIVAFGINEIGQQLSTPVLFDTDESYAEALGGYLDEIQSILPDAKIYFSSILPANDVGVSLQPGFSIIPRRNEVIRKYCKESGYGYIDVEPVADAHQDLYISDGVHFYEEFYPYWASAILAQIMEDGGIS